MKKYLLLFLILFIIELLKCEENENIKNIDYNKLNNFDDKAYAEFNNSLDNITVTKEEIDKLLFCGVLLQIKVRLDEKIIEEIAAELNQPTKEEALDIIGGHLLSKCFNRVSLKTAQKFFVDGLYMKEIENKEYEQYSEYHDIDYNIFRNRKDLKVNETEIEMILKFYKALNIHNQRQDALEENRRKEQKENEEKIKAVGIDLLNIPTYIKSIVFIIVFGLVFGGCLYFVNSIINKPKKDKKDKKKKKKNQ